MRTCLDCWDKGTFHSHPSRKNKVYSILFLCGGIDSFHKQKYSQFLLAKGNMDQCKQTQQKSLWSSPTRPVLHVCQISSNNLGTVVKQIKCKFVELKLISLSFCYIKNVNSPLFFSQTQWQCTYWWDLQHLPHNEAQKYGKKIRR